MSSTLYTIGTALRRAHAGSLRVDLLVETQWVAGRVVAIDGHGVIIEHDDAEVHSVVRLESVSAVRVQGAAPATPAGAPDPGTSTTSSDAPGPGSLLRV